MTRGARALLEPGVLLSGLLFRDLVQSRSADALAVGTRLGAFRVIRELGRGGMGVVHLAERDDGAFSQQVALKCMADRGSAAGTELFRRERQILASLRHPNIARLLDGGGADDGVLWFAMEWVEGERIDRHCARRALPLDERLRLWIGVAEAVRFAHARLLIHRDIKPGNVLVDVDGQPRLLDFGIATLLGDASGPRAYSPGHASPEQRDGAEVGTASDQYQLGRLLDTMLGSRRASDDSRTSAVAPVASTGDATITTGIGSSADRNAARATAAVASDAWIAMPGIRRGELLAVLARACATDPAARYGSVAELKSDVQRILDRQPIDSRRGRWFYQLGCAWRRRPLTALMATATVIAVMTLMFAFSARLARERDVAEAENAKVKAINAFVKEDLLATANPFEVSQSDLTVREALDRARDRVGSRFADQPMIESELRQTLGKTYVGVGELAAAKDQLQQALQLRAAFAADDSEASVDIRLLLVQCAVAASEYADAEARVRTLLDELARSRPSEDPQRLRANIALVEVLGFLGRAEEAMKLDRELSAQLASLGPAHVLNREYADVRGHLLLSLGRAQEALAIFDDAAQQGATISGADDYRVLRSLEGKARALRDLGKTELAVPVFRELYSQRLAVFGREHRETLRNHNELAVALSRSGDRQAAIAIWTEDLEIKQRRLGSVHASTLSTRYNLGNELIASARYAEAEHAFRNLLDAERAARGASDPGVLTTQISLANAISRQNRQAEALILLDDARTAGRETLSARPELGILLVYRSRVQVALKRYEPARADALAAIAVFESTVGREHRRTLQAREWLASLPALRSKR